MGLTGSDADGIVDDLAASLRSGMDSLDDSLTVGWPSATVIETVLARVDRLDAGQSLGEQPANVPRSIRTLDGETAQRQS